MAFDLALLNVGPSSGGTAVKISHYGKTADTKAQVAAAGYFNSVPGYFNDGDMLHVAASNGTALYAVGKSGSTITLTLIVETS